MRCAVSECLWLRSAGFGSLASSKSVHAARWHPTNRFGAQTSHGCGRIGIECLINRCLTRKGVVAFAFCGVPALPLKLQEPLKLTPAPTPTGALDRYSSLRIRLQARFTAPIRPLLIPQSICVSHCCPIPLLRSLFTTLHPPPPHTLSPSSTQRLPRPLKHYLVWPCISD